MPRRPQLCLVLGAALAAGPALAQDQLSFRTPSGNIHCMAWIGPDADLRCDVSDLTASFATRPADCDLDWGHAFAVGPAGPGAPLCVGDTVIDPGAGVLPYGQRLQFGPFACQSAETGLTCQNAGGGGFFLSRASQRVF